MSNSCMTSTNPVPDRKLAGLSTHYEDAVRRTVRMVSRTHMGPVSNLDRAIARLCCGVDCPGSRSLIDIMESPSWPHASGLVLADLSGGRVRSPQRPCS